MSPHGVVVSGVSSSENSGVVRGFSDGGVVLLSSGLVFYPTAGMVGDSRVNPWLMEVLGEAFGIPFSSQGSIALGGSPIVVFGFQIL